MRFRFNEISLYTERFELRDGDALVPVEPKVLDFLLHMATNPDRVISKDEIIEHIWDGRIVSEATISGCVKAARRAVGDDGQAQRIIKTVHGRGFRFVAELQNLSKPAQPTGVEIFVQPSLLILPVRSNGDDRLEVFGASVGEKLITALARVPFLTVISSRVAAGLEKASISDLRREIGSGYVLDISLRAAGGLVGANLQLSETLRGGTVWAHQFQIDEQDDPEQVFMGECLPHLELALVKSIFEMLRADPAATGSKPLLIQALGTMSEQGWHGKSFAQAETLLRRSVALEPNLAMANATLALILALGQKVGFAAPSAALVKEAISLADKALSLDDGDSTILGLAGCALADAGEISRAKPLLKRALHADPNNAQALAALGSVHLHLGDLNQAAEMLELSVAVSPLDKRQVIWCSVLAIVQIKLGDLACAREQAQMAVDADDRTYFSRVVMTAVHLEQNDLTAARAALAECRRVHPDLTTEEVSAIVGYKLGERIMELSSLAD